MARIKRQRKFAEIEALPDNAKLSIAKAADLIGYSPDQLYNYIDAGKLKFRVVHKFKTIQKKIVGSEIKRFCRVN